MTEKRFKVEKNIFDGYCIADSTIDGYYAYDKQDLERLCDSLNEFVTKCYDLEEENEQLKQQLLYDGDSVCDICKHEYLTPSGDYFISNCRKGHEECSKEDLRYCTDFEVKELKE